MSRNWTRYIAKRMTALVCLVFVISLGTYSLMALAPGSLVDSLLGPRGRTPEAVAAVRQEYHLNDPFLVRYGEWLGGAVRFDFGNSVRTDESVASGIEQRAGVTVTLALMAFAMVLLVGVPLGMLAATRKGGALDGGVVSLTTVGVSAPPFASGVVLLYLFAVVLGWFPPFGAGQGFLDRLWHLTLPAVALALTAAAIVVRVTRSTLIRELSQDYVVFARARGISRREVLTRYALRNALVPIVTVSGLVLGYMVGGAVLVEIAFSLPGLGSFLVDSIQYKDLPAVQGVVIVIAVFILLVNFLTDLLYVVIDPRIRLGGEVDG